ncbi:MAG: hypothetical protein PHX83_00265 [Acidobacteriia bacterium]|nr:hypothetical protein [Terriglobia bacterium]
MKFEAYFGEQLFPVEVKEDGERVFLQVESVVYESQAVELAPGRYSIVHDRKVYDVVVEASNDGQFQVQWRDRRISLELLDPRKLKSMRHRHAESDGEVAVCSPMPGKIVRLLVSEEEHVERGQGLIVVEAMKMQNELKAPREGILKSIKVAEGKTVNAGEELMVIG